MRTKLYPFITLEDKTEIVHSECYTEDDCKKVKVCIEKPICGGFQSAQCAQCILPEYKWQNINAFKMMMIRWCVTSGYLYKQQTYVLQNIDKITSL